MYKDPKAPALMAVESLRLLDKIKTVVKILEKENFVFRKGVIKKFNGAFLVSKKKYYIRKTKFSTPIKNFRTVL